QRCGKGAVLKKVTTVVHGNLRCEWPRTPRSPRQYSTDTRARVAFRGSLLPTWIRPTKRRCSAAGGTVRPRVPSRARDQTDDRVTARPEVPVLFPGRRPFPHEEPCCRRFPRSGGWHWPDDARIAAVVRGSLVAP